MAQARFDKVGRRLPDTGRGCGCDLCAATGAPRYERRSDPARGGGEWSPFQRRLLRWMRSLAPGRRSQAAA